MQLVDVCINLPVKQIDKNFTYYLPDDFTKADVGWRVMVSFAGSLTEGFIVKKYSQLIEQDLKPVIELIDDSPWFDEKAIELATFISEYYLCSLSQAMRLFLPGKKSLKKQIFYVVGQEAINYKAQTDYEKNLIDLLQEKVADKTRIKGKLGFFDEQTVKLLVQKEVLQEVKSAKNKFKKQTAYYAKLICNAKEYLNDNPKCPRARKKALELLSQTDIMPLELLAKEGISKDTLIRMQKISLVQIIEKHITRDSYKDMLVQKRTIALNNKQQEVFEKINDSIEKKCNQTYLLHGITGSGKTQIYIELAQTVYQNDGQVLVLVPEIALTSQIITRFKQMFEQDVLVFHSRLSLNERMDVFEYVKTGASCILIGTRSAIFAPFANLGIVIIDEEHEYSYKQEESPGYNAKTVAEKLCQINNIPLLLASATPSIDNYYLAKEGIYKLLILKERANFAQLPDIEVVDMKQELQEGNKGVISRKLFAALEQVLEESQQAIILLNRRGYATFVLCRDCGYVEKCEHCSVSLVYHQNDKLLRCHYCGYIRQVPDECPNCSSRKIRFFGSGTQKAQEQLNETLPNLRIARMDQDTTSKKFAHDKILQDFAKGKQNLLLGTQMVAKGHDVHNVTLVGILSADSLLSLPDFRAGERTFSLLLQAAGRAGRGDKKGRVILQTYQTQHPVMQYVVNQDYESFANYELQDREELFYPPYSSIIKITVIAKQEDQAVNRAKIIVKELQEKFDSENTQINGPFKGMVAKVKDSYKLIIIIKSNNIQEIKQYLKDKQLNIQKDIIIDIDPLNVL